MTEPSHAHPSPDFFDAAIETMPRAQLEKLQESRLLQLVPYVYNRSPLIRAVWAEAGVKPEDICSIGDFREKVPFIDKDTIRRFRDTHNDPFGGLACASVPHMKGVGFTSGTTGDPTPVPRGKDTLSVDALKREFWHIGARPGDYVVNMMFTFREGHYADRYLDSGMIPIMFEHHPAELPRLLQAARHFGPKVLYMLSTPLILGLEQLEKQSGTDMRQALSCFRGAVFGGEPLAPRLRGLLQRWGLEVFEYASLGDIAGAMECRAHDGLHTWEDMVLVENLDPLGDTPVADGARGELVVTALIDDVGPLVRYRTDDLIEFTRKPCSCGRTHGRMRIIGRKGDEMVIAGKSVLPRDLFAYVQAQPETSAGLFQLVRACRESDKLVLRVGYDAKQLQGSTDDLAARLTSSIAQGLQVPVDIELRDNEELLKQGPPHKIPRVTKS
jgi:phenylacetate-CoA ligase